MLETTVQTSTATVSRPPRADDPQTVAEPTSAGADRQAASDEGQRASADAALVVEELLVEDVSIDGMCGVY